MKNQELNLYYRLTRLFFVPKRFQYRLLLILSIAGASPLLSVFIYFSLSSTAQLQDHFILIGLIFMATIGGIITAYALLSVLLQPVWMSAYALHKYIADNEVPQLPSGGIDSFEYLMTDVQQTIEKCERLQHEQNQGALDRVTGALNRASAELYLQQDIARAYRDKGALLTVLLEVDNFEHITNEFGQAMAEVCLAHIVDKIKHNIRSGDWIAHWESGKFLLILWNFNHHNPLHSLQRIQNYSLKTPMGELLDVSLTIGACEYQGENQVGSLLLRVNKALTQAKEAETGGIMIENKSQQDVSLLPS